MRGLRGKKIVIIGLGLIGGSLARSLTQAGFGGELVAVGRDTTMLERALADGSISAFSVDARAACAGADIVVIAVPVLAIEPLLREIAPVLVPETVITDVASVKQAVVGMATNVFGRVPPRMVPGHPIAGSEQSGYEASTASLFRQRKVVLTPSPATDPEALDIVRSLWQLTGAEVLEMAAARHDEVLAATSHLPHLLAFALVDTLSQQGESEEIFRYAAGGFRDFTRIASSDPVMWRDIFATNGEATVRILDKYMADLQRLRQALLDRDAETLHSTFKRARQSRAAFLALGRSADEPQKKT